MVAFGFLVQNLGRWPGPTNGTLSIYECRFSGGDTMSWGGGALKPYLSKKMFELSALTSDEDAKTSSAGPHARAQATWKNSLFVLMVA